MLTAHLPSGYCLGKAKPLTGFPFLMMLLGAVFPALDMLFFHFVDNGSIHHHRYWVHIPFFWIVAAAIVLPVVWKTRFRSAALAFLAGNFLHLVLDSIGGGVMWGAPFSDRLWEFVTVPATQSHWILSFILHWTFLLEIAIWACAAYLMFGRTRE